MTEDWEKTVLTDEEMREVDHQLGQGTDYYQIKDDDASWKFYHNFFCKAQAKATWKVREPEIVAAYQAGIKKGRQEVMDWSRESCPHTITELVDDKFEDISKGECSKCWEAKKKEWGLG